MTDKELQKQGEFQRAKRLAPILLFFAVAMAVIASPAMAAKVCGTNITCIDPDMLDFSNLSTLIGNIAGIFPGVVSLVVGVIPILFILAIVGLVFSIFGAVIGMIEGLMRGLFK